MTTTDLLKACYAAYAANDLDAITGQLHPDAVYHVAGRHPLSGDKIGRDEVLGYLIQVATTSGFRGGFEVTSVAEDGDIGYAWVIGTAFDGDEPYTRPILHLARFEDGLVKEFWDAPFDQHREDEFWSAAASGGTR